MKPKLEHKDHIVVLGAGIIGVCCALSLVEKGFSVTLIDRNEPGEAASFGNAGVISPWSVVPQCLPGIWRNVPKWLLDKDGPVTVKWKNLPTVLPWALRFFANGNVKQVNEIANNMSLLMEGNISAYRRFLTGTGHEYLLADSWYINVFRGNHKPDLKDLAWKLRLDRKAPVEIIDQQELMKLEPGLSDECHSAVIIKDQARAVSPVGLCKALAEKAIGMGARFVRAEINRISPREDGSFDLSGGEVSLHCDKLVLAGGIWSAELMKTLGIKLPLISERGYHAEFAEPGVKLNNSIMDVAGKFVASSMAGGIRLAGTSEFASVDAPPDYSRSKALQRMAKKLLPDLNCEKPSYWMGVRSSFPDNLPAISRVPGFEKLIAAFGHSHYGMGMAPATGRIVASIASGEATNENIKAFSISRFL